MLSKKIIYSILLVNVVFLFGCLQTDQQKPSSQVSEKHSELLPKKNVTVIKKIDSAYSILADEEALPVAVLGGGVAGLMSATYLSQAGVPVIVLQGEKPGGALAQSHSVRNWPGEVNIPGVKIMEKMRKQAMSGGNVKIFNEKVIKVDFSSRPYHIYSVGIENGKEYEHKVHCCIIAMGNEPNYLRISGETGADGYWGRGVTNCAICDGALYKGKRVGIVGGGDGAVTEADYLSGLASEVYIFVRKNSFRAKNIAVKDNVLKRSNVKVFFNTEVKRIYGDGKKVVGVDLLDNQHGVKRRFDLDGLFLAIGSRPNTEMLKGQLDLTRSGFIVLGKNQETSLPGVYAAGDICGSISQAVVAAADGCKAALSLERELKEIGFVGTESKIDMPQEEKEEVRKAMSLKHGEHHAVMEIKNGEEFEEFVKKSDIPVVMDLYSTWCIPCQKMAPIFEKVAKEFDGKVRFVKINVASKDIKLPVVLGKLNAEDVASVPTIIFLKDSKEIDRWIGMISEPDLKQKTRENFRVN